MHSPVNTAHPQWTIHGVLCWTTSHFESLLLESPRLDAEMLLAHALGLTRAEVCSRLDMPLCPHDLQSFKALILRRARREPVAHIVGFKGFWSLDLAVTADVLIPRPETEHLVEAALSILPRLPSNCRPQRILDLGTGSGAILLALASERPGHLFLASDRSPRALKVARHNAALCDLEGAVRLFCGDWFRPLGRGFPPFDMILSNPPYIRSGVLARLQPEIRNYEPSMALDGGKDGLDAYRIIIWDAHAHLTVGGTLLLEIGHDQKADIRKLINACGGYDENVRFIKDYSGYDRVVHMRKKG